MSFRDLLLFVILETVFLVALLATIAAGEHAFSLIIGIVMVLILAIFGANNVRH